MTGSSAVVWRDTDEGYKPFLVDEPDTPISWAPQPGSQIAFLTCPVAEVLYEGTRGPGKTDALLMDFGQFVGQGYGEEWRGILFRRTYPELQDVIDKSKKWFKQIWPQAQFNEAKTFWEWPTGEKLFFRQFSRQQDYWSYHGHAYPWIAWEELTTWPDDKCYKSMFACNRSTVPGIPLRVRASTNPYGIGHNWVKARWRLPVKPGHVIGELITDAVDQDGELEPPRVAVHGYLQENQILLRADPNYVSKIRAAARNRSELKAWLEGCWDIVAGGMFDDIWIDARDCAVIPAFKIPNTWTIDRSFDWGSSKPFSVGWWAQSDGSDVVLANGKTTSTVRGDLFRIHEWYGWNGNANEGKRMMATDITKGIIERELAWNLHGRVKAGPADSSIFDEENGNSIARDMENSVLVDGKRYPGVSWERADKSPGSRKQGWEQVRKMLANTLRDQGKPREYPGLFIFDHCSHWLRTVPVLPRSDKDIDDVDTDAEDHIGDETRYRARYERKVVRSGRVSGLV